jgi:amidohydrolase
MHACGHDSHMAMVLGACRYAVANEERLRGTLMAIFQPSEEVRMGARSMLEAGVFSRLKPFRLVGIHNWPDLPAGTLGLQSGPITASTDQFKAVLRGVGGHGARPHQTRDTIAMAAAAVQNAFTLAQRRADPASPQVLSFGAIRGGTSFNIIPEQVVLEGTVRTVRSEDQALMIRLLHQASKQQPTCTEVPMN